MSAYSEIKTEFKDGDLLIEALKTMGFNPTNCIGKPSPLYGIGNDFRTKDGRGHTTNPDLAMKADIIIPKSQVGSSANDIGFVKSADGTYKAIISDYDSHRYDGKWLNTVKANVADAGIQRTAKRMGMRIASRKVTKGQIEYEFLKV